MTAARADGDGGDGDSALARERGEAILEAMALTEKEREEGDEVIKEREATD